MVVLTAKDIIKQAKFISQTTNSNLTDYYVSTNLLSSIYRNLYNDIIGSDNAFVETIETSDTKFELSGVYKVVYVGFKDGSQITRSQLRNGKTGGYYIENNTLIMPHGLKEIKICPLPATITAPDDFEETTLETVPADFSNAGVDSDGNPTTAESLYYHGEFIDFSNLPSFIEKEDTTIVNVNVSDPFMYVSYSDGTIRLYDGETWVDVNPYVEKGKGFRGKVVAFSADSDTGKGVIIYDSIKNKYLYGSFVPNTVLNYPDNTFFDVMIYKLAALLSSLQNIQNPYLINNLLPEAEERFTESLNKGGAVRFTNTRGGRYYVR